VTAPPFRCDHTLLISCHLAATEGHPTKQPLREQFHMLRV